MNFNVIATGSSGNCFWLEDGKSKLLLEAGVSFRQIQSGTKYMLSSFGGALITHSHLDHAKSVKDLTNNGIDCYMSDGCASDLGVDGYRIKRVRAGKSFAIETFSCIPFEVKHDATEPFGFLIRSEIDKQSLLFIMDTFYIHQRFKNFTYLAIECNYITESLIDGGAHPALKKRVMQSHMSLETCLKFLKEQDLSKCRMIYLIHLSKERGDAETMRRAVARETGCQVVVT